MTYKKCKTLKDLNDDPRAFGAEWEVEDNGQTRRVWVSMKTDEFTVDGERCCINEPTIKEACFVMNNWIEQIV
jgi:hypothetical protein